LSKNEQTVPVVNESNFDEMLKTRNRVIVLIYASWCPFCMSFLPVFSRYSREMADHCFMVKDDRETIADKYEVDVVPTVLFFENGVVSKRLDGILGVGLHENQLAEFIHHCNLSAG
jgi:thioredoxin 1